MKKLMFVAVAAISVAAFAHDDVSAKAEGYYDVTLTTKHLAHAEKTVSKTFTTSKSKGYAVDQFWAHMAVVTNYAGFTIISGGVAGDVEKEVATKIAVTYSYFDFKTDRTTGAKSMVTKVVSKSSKGLYDAKSGKVYLWDTADKVGVQYGDVDAIVESEPTRTGDEKIQTGYKAYEVPLAMHKQFVATDDGKAAGGFTGGVATATDGSTLDFNGLTAFGTGTIDKDDNLKTVAGNVAGKYPNDLKYGCYGTWKLNLDSKSAKYGSLKDALLAKKCVELVNERD